MKLLIGIATFPDEPFVYEATTRSINEAVAQLPSEIECEIRLYRDLDMTMEAMDRLRDKHNLMKADVLAEGFDALLTIEADIIIPVDAITKLLEVEADVVYGLYVSRKEGMWLCFEKVEGFKAAALNSDPTKAKKLMGKVIKSEGVGFGCTLLYHRVLEAITFRRELKRPFADDWYMAIDVKAAGFVSKHHLGIVCGHTDRDGTVMWPDVESERLFRRDGIPAEKRPDLLESDTYAVLKPLLMGNGGNYLGAGDFITLDRRSAERLLARNFIKKVGNSDGSNS